MSAHIWDEQKQHQWECQYGEKSSKSYPTERTVKNWEKLTVGNVGISREKHSDLLYSAK